MPTVKVELRDVFSGGERRVAVEVPVREGGTINDALVALAADFQTDYCFLAKCVLVMDGAVVHPDTPVTGGCLLKVFPPICGGSIQRPGVDG